MMRKVTKEEFFSAIGSKNVHPQIQNGDWPYWSLWKGLDSYTRDTVYGKTANVFKNGNNGFTIMEYWLP